METALEVFRLLTWYLFVQTLAIYTAHKGVIVGRMSILTQSAVETPR